MTTVTYEIIGDSSDVDTFKLMIWRLLHMGQHPDLTARLRTNDTSSMNNTPEEISFKLIINEVKVSPFRVIGRMDDRRGKEISIEFDPKTSTPVFDILT